MEENKTQTLTQCPNCGAPVAYDIESGAIKCTHCEFKKSVPGNFEYVARRDLSDGIKSSKDETVAVYKCGNCGAKETIKDKGVSNRCPFCGSTNFVLESGGEGLNPDSVLPFAITRSKAEELFKAWLASRKMLPKSFKTEDIRKNIKQLYFPAWSFSAKTQTAYSGKMGRNIQYTYYANRKAYTGTRMEYSPISSTLYWNYSDCLIPADEKIDAKNFEKLKPFDLQNIKPFKPDFINGVDTEYYSHSLEDGFDDFSNFVRADAKRRIKERHNADDISKIVFETLYEERKFNYMLLPIYTAEYSFKRKKYAFFINGISGKIVGKSPKSLWKILFFSLGFGLLAGVTAYLVWKLST